MEKQKEEIKKGMTELLNIFVNMNTIPIVVSSCNSVMLQFLNRKTVASEAVVDYSRSSAETEYSVANMKMIIMACITDLSEQYKELTDSDFFEDIKNENAGLHSNVSEDNYSLNNAIDFLNEKLTEASKNGRENSRAEETKKEENKSRDSESSSGSSEEEAGEGTKENTKKPRKRTKGTEETTED